MQLPPAKWMSIDPGDIHQGVCWWAGAVCTHGEELGADNLIPRMRTFFEQGCSLVVFEKFALYGAQAALMVGNEFETVQMIGRIKQVCEDAGVQYMGYLARQHKTLYDKPWFTSLSVRQKRTLPFWGKGNHVKDAWCLGTYYKSKHGVDVAGEI